MIKHILMLLCLLILQSSIYNVATASGDTIINDNSTTNNYSGSGGGGNSGHDLNTAGVAIAGAAGVCVRDWTKGMQYCASWAMVDGDDYDEGVHAFGGGVTTRVDTFALSFYGGVENIDDDDKTYMLTGSINWR